MNSYSNNQRSSVLFFIVGCTLSVGLLAGAGVLTKLSLGASTLNQGPGTASCLSAMRVNGFSPSESNGTISLIAARTAGVEMAVNQVGVLVAHCPAHTLKEFCAGPACARPGITLTLRPK